MNKTANITIVICTRDRADDLHQTLLSLSQIEVPKNLSVELLVIDNGSSDHTSSVVQNSVFLSGMSVRYIIETKPGLSHARNTALTEALGEILLFTDDDNRLPKNWISLMCSPILADKAHAVAGNVVIAPHLERTWMKPVHRSYLASHQGGQQEPTQMTGANMGFSREVLSKVSKFDTELGAGALGCCEETLFSWQMINAGYKIVAVPEATAMHHFQETRLLRKSFIASAKAVGRSQAYIQYHWEHTDQRHVFIRRLRKAAQIWIKQLRQKPVPEDTEGISPWEIEAVAHLSLLVQFAYEQKRTRKYYKYGTYKRY